MEVDFLDRLNSYKEDVCWQYKMRVDNLSEDVKSLPIWIKPEDIKVSDFTFKPLTTQAEREEAKEFIKRHEWLGTITMYTTHYFGAYYGDLLAGVILMSVPNAFSKILGENSDTLERLISRGACISWSPKNLASHFMMWCIRWMVQNTTYRVFTAYSDPTAKELGSIYQACSFYYLGNGFGGTTKYINPYTGKVASDRCFRHTSFYKKYAQELGIEWGNSWIVNGRLDWTRVPEDIKLKLKAQSKLKQAESKKIVVPSKHKYAFVLGRDKKETKELRRNFLALNKTYDYPKERGK